MIGNDKVARRRSALTYPRVKSLQERLAITNHRMAVMVHGEISANHERVSKRAKRRLYRLVGVAAVAEAIREAATDAVGTPGSLLIEAISPRKRIELPPSSIESAWSTVGAYLQGSITEAHLKLSSND